MFKISKQTIIILLISIVVIGLGGAVLIARFSIENKKMPLVAKGDPDHVITLTQENLKEDYKTYVNQKYRQYRWMSVFLLSAGSIMVVFSAASLIIKLTKKTFEASALSYILPLLIIGIIFIPIGLLLGHSATKQMNALDKPIRIEKVQIISKDRKESRDSEGSVSYDYYIKTDADNKNIWVSEYEYDRFESFAYYYRAKNANGHVFRYYPATEFSE